MSEQMKARDTVRFLKEEELLRYLQAGFTLKQCAKALKLHYWTTRKYAGAPHFVEKLKALGGDIWSRVDAEIGDQKFEAFEKMQEASAAALEEMLNLATESQSEHIRFKACQDLMDRDPQISRTRRIEGDVGGKDSSGLNPITLQFIAKVAKEEDSRRVINVTPTEPLKLPAEEPSGDSSSDTEFPTVSGGGES